ncbi:MAG: membrane protein insertion efficiency factor YidD [Bacteroidota bacterium]
MSPAATILVTLVRTYRALLSPILPFNQCRFLPSCSEYAIEALRKHGAWRGTGLAGRRILRCHPYSKHGGFDPVP